MDSTGMFRGKRVDTGEWVYGYYFLSTIIQMEGNEKNGYSEIHYEIDPTTIGQSTGARDCADKKHPKEIYEGDIVKVERLDSFPSWNRAVIVYSDHQASFLLQYTKPTEPKGILADCSRITSKDKKAVFGHIYEWTIEIIGNIYENPELLEGK